VALKDGVAVGDFDTWHAQSAQLGIASVVAQNHVLHLVAFQWPDSFRSRVSRIRCTKCWDCADLTPNHRIIVSDRHHPNTWCRSCTINVTAGHPSAPSFGAALYFGAGSAPLGLFSHSCTWYLHHTGPHPTPSHACLKRLFWISDHLIGWTSELMHSIG